MKRLLLIFCSVLMFSSSANAIFCQVGYKVCNGECIPNSQTCGSSGGGSGSGSTVNTCLTEDTNLFDSSDYDVFYGYWNANTAYKIDDYSLNAFVYMPCEPNTTYTIGGAAGANNLMIGTTSVIPTAGTVVSGTTNGAIRSITTASDAKYLLILVLRDTDGATTSNRDSIIAENVANMYVRTGGYTISGTSPSDHDSVSDCKITCEGGSYLASANALTCRDVGSGYWAAQSVISQGDTGIRNKCESGLTTIGYGAGADELGDCGRVLHVGEHQIYLRSDKKTTPSLNVGINGVVYYSNMSTEVDGNLKIKYNDLIYSVYDDSM